jgi:hypothetical protein
MCRANAVVDLSRSLDGKRPYGEVGHSGSLHPVLELEGVQQGVSRA